MTAGFFGKSRQPTPGASRIDLDNARRLFAVLKSIDPGTKGSISVWADEFRLLAKERAELDIDRVLNWFEIHSQSRWTPAVRSAKQFRSKFDQLLAAADRGEEDNPTVLIGQEAREIQTRLGGLIWPGDEKKHELELIQASLDGFRRWSNSVRKAKVSKPELSWICDWLLEVHGDPALFVQSWVESVHRTAWTNERWAGKLGRHAAGERHPRFQSLVSAWIAEYKGGRGDWWSWFVLNFMKGDGR